MFYAFIENSKINGCGQCKCLNENVISLEITKEQYNNIIENGSDFYLYKDGELVLNPNYEQELAEARKEEFLKQFFKIDGYGYFRKQPKGYGSAVESLNTAFNIVTVLGNLPANTLTFYAEPDFTIAEQCTEEWLVENATKNEEMTPSEFGTFYAQFMMAWNTQEHQ